MDCPIDGTSLAITDRQGIEVDYCPKCRGVWLDRGELDKLIERSAEWESSGRDRRSDRDDYRGRDDRRDRDDYRDRPQYDKRKKKKSLLSEIFEFGD